MSGFKHTLVSIPEEEYRHLHDLAMKKLSRESKKHNREVASLRTENEQLQQALWEKERDFEDTLASLQNEMGRLELETQQELLAGQEDMYRDLLSRLEYVWDENAGMQEILVEMDKRLQEENTRREAHIHDTEKFIQGLSGDLRSREELAVSWLRSACSLADFIEKQYEHDRFAAGQYDRISNELDLAQANLSQGVPEAALMGGQLAYLHFSDLRLELQQRTHEWQMLFEFTNRAARDLYDLVRENAVCPALDLEGNQLPFTLQMNFWSQGAYSDLLNRLKSLIFEIRERSAEISSEELRTCLRQELPHMRQEFDDMLFTARLCAINSQIRINIADLSVQALEGQGFVLEQAGYYQGDRRNPFNLTLRNIEGSCVTIQVDPLESSERGQDLSIVSSDSEQRTEHELRQRSREIMRALLQVGLQVGQLQESSSPAPRVLPLSREQKINKKPSAFLQEVSHAGTD